MFNTDITLTPSSGVTGTSSVARTFSLISVEESKGVRKNASAALSEPQLLTISHQNSGGTGKEAVRHVIRVDQTFAASGTLPAQQASAYMVIVAPTNTVTIANINDLVGLLIAFAKDSSNLAKVYNGEP